ncbi:hypothetical protein V8G54_032666, partial [Vigna mungo]
FALHPSLPQFPLHPSLPSNAGEDSGEAHLMAASVINVPSRPPSLKVILRSLKQTGDLTLRNDITGSTIFKCLQAQEKSQKRNFTRGSRSFQEEPQEPCSVLVQIKRKAALEIGASLSPDDSRFVNLIKECDKLIVGFLSLGYSTPFLSLGSSYMYPSLVAAKATVISVREEIATQGLPLGICPLVFVFTGPGNGYFFLSSLFLCKRDI